MATLNNNQIATILNEAIAQSTGADEIDTLDLSGIVDRGNDTNVIGSVESFTKALLNVITKYWFTDSSYRSQYENPFFEDSARFGAIIEAISIEVPEVKESHAWKDFTPTTSNGTTTYATAGVYNLYLPTVSKTLYGKSVSWELPIAVTNEQWDTAFHSEAALRTFVDYIFLVVDNALICHIENMDNANRNALIASKIVKSQEVAAVGLHKINLVQAYQESLATQTDMTVNGFLNSKDALRFASEELRKYMSYMRKMSVLFNTAGKRRFIPKEREVVQILEAFKLRVESASLSSTFHDAFVSLPLSQSVPYWQGFGDNATFDEVSKIDVSLDGTNDVTQSGVVALIADKWACMHTVKNHRVASTYFDPEAVTQYYYQYRDQYMIDTTQNALVFTLENYTAPEAGGDTPAEGGES